MNRTIFSLLVLLLFGLFSQPSLAQRSPQRAQQEAEEGVAKMSEAEMRALLPTLKARYEELRNILNTKNYGKYSKNFIDNDPTTKGITEGVAQGIIMDEYNCVTADINAIEKRLGEIEEKRRQEEEKKKKEQEELEKKKKEQEELERQKKEQEELERQRQEELERQRQEELERQRQAEFQESFERNLEESQERYNKHHTDVDNNSEAIREKDRALERATSERDPNSVPITDAMLDEQLSTTSNTKLGDISSKFNTPKETKEEPEETKEESEDDKRRRELIEKVQNHLNSLEK